MDSSSSVFSCTPPPAQPPSTPTLDRRHSYHPPPSSFTPTHNTNINPIIKRLDSGKRLETPPSPSPLGGGGTTTTAQKTQHNEAFWLATLNSPEFITYSVYRIWHKQPSVQFVPSQEALEWFPMTIQAVERVLAHTSSPVHVLLGLLYVARLKAALPKTPLKHPGSEYKILMAGLLLAHKFHTDLRIPNASWSLLCGLQTQDLFRMESEFLQAIKGRLFVKPKEFELWKASVLTLHQEFTVYKKIQAMDQEQQLRNLSLSSSSPSSYKKHPFPLPEQPLTLPRTSTGPTPSIQITPPSDPSQEQHHPHSLSILNSSSSKASLPSLMEEDEKEEQEDNNNDGDRKGYLSPLHATLRRKSSVTTRSSPSSSRSTQQTPLRGLLLPARKSVDYSALPRAKTWTTLSARSAKRRESDAR